MPRTIGLIAFLVREYDEAIHYFVNKLNFELIEDTPREAEKRWVVVSPPGRPGTRILLARAVTPKQAAAVGNQSGGRVFLFLETGDFWNDYQAMVSRGVKFLEKPREEPYGTVAVFQDLYGNKWDLLQSKST